MKLNHDDWVYLAELTEVWHKNVPETRNYVVCSLYGTTHVIFSEVDLKLAGKDGRNFTMNHVYPIQRIEESGDLLIIDDKGQKIIGFHLFIPCEYLKEKPKIIKDNPMQEYCSPKVVSLSNYRNNRGRI